MIEEDAGRHEDGTADDERLADESRAVTGLGEAAGLGGIRAGEVLRGVCRLLLCDLLCLLSCNLIGKLLLRCDAVGLRQLVGSECRIIAGLELVHSGLLLVQDGLGGRDLGTCLDCGGEKRVEGVIRVHIMAGSDRRAGIDGVQLRQLGVCLCLRLFGGGDQGLGGNGIRLRGIEGGLGVIDGLYCILLALLCLCELRGKTGEDVEVRLCVLEIGLGAGEPVGGNAGVGLCGIDGTLGIREGACGGVCLLLGGGEDGRLLDLIGCRRVMDALCGIERLLGGGDGLEDHDEDQVTQTAKAVTVPPTNLDQTGRNVIIGLAATLAAAAAAAAALIYRRRHAYPDPVPAGGEDDGYEEDARGREYRDDRYPDGYDRDPYGYDDGYRDSYRDRY